MGKRLAFFRIGSSCRRDCPAQSPYRASAQTSTTRPGSSTCGSGDFTLRSMEACIDAGQSLGLDPQGSEQGIQLARSAWRSRRGSRLFRTGAHGRPIIAAIPDCNHRASTAGSRISTIRAAFPCRAARQALNQERALAEANLRAPQRNFNGWPGASLGSLLPVYGDSLFQVVPSTFAPVRQVPVTSDYVLGPGDQLVVRIWGQVNFNSELTVDRSGRGVFTANRRDSRRWPALLTNRGASSRCRRAHL